MVGLDVLHSQSLAGDQLDAMTDEELDRMIDTVSLPFWYFFVISSSIFTLWCSVERRLFFFCKKVLYRKTVKYLKLFLRQNYLSGSWKIHEFFYKFCLIDLQSSQLLPYLIDQLSVHEQSLRIRISSMFIILSHIVFLFSG